MRLLRPCLLLLATSIALPACGGAGQSTPAPPPVVCQIAAPLYLDPMTQPPAGAVGVSTTIGSITVPQMNGVLGTTLQIAPPTGSSLTGGVFVASGPSSLTATVPRLQPNTLYHAFVIGIACGPIFDFGQFTTGAT